MSAAKNQPPSASAAQPPSSRPAESPPPLTPLAAQAMLADALSGVAAAAATSGVSTVPEPLRIADTVLRRAAALATSAATPDGLAERTIAKCLTVALDGSMAGEVVV